MTTGSIDADIKAIEQFSRDVAELAGSVRALANAYPDMTTVPKFGELASSHQFTAADQLSQAYSAQLRRFVVGNSNLSDLAAQLDKLSAGTSRIAAEYRTGVINELNDADAVKNAFSSATVTTASSAGIGG